MILFVLVLFLMWICVFRCDLLLLVVSMMICMGCLWEVLFVVLIVVLVMLLCVEIMRVRMWLRVMVLFFLCILMSCLVIWLMVVLGRLMIMGVFRFVCCGLVGCWWKLDFMILVCIV